MTCGNCSDFCVCSETLAKRLLEAATKGDYHWIQRLLNAGIFPTQNVIDAARSAHKDKCVELLSTRGGRHMKFQHKIVA